MADQSGGASGYDPKALGGTLGGKLQGYVNTPAPGLGWQSQASLKGLWEGADPGGFTGSIGSTISDFGDIASGKRFGMNDPGYATLRDRVADDTLTGINSSFNNSGLFGSDGNMEAAGRGLGDALAGLDYANFQSDRAQQFGAADRLGGLYGVSQLPQQQRLGVGQAQDLAGNADYDRFLQLLGAFNGSSQSPGMAPEVPWYQTALGLGATGAGILGSFL